MRKFFRHGFWAALLAAVMAPGAALGQERLAIFDAHLHYNQEPTPFYSLDQVREVFRRNGVSGILATSRPNKGTHQLVDANWPEFRVVPFIRPYRVRSDIQTWFKDPAIFDLITSEYARGYYRGIGEFHIYGKDAALPWVKKVVDFAVEKNLYLHAHCDEEALLILFSHNPKVRIIWAHTGFSVPAARVAALLEVASRCAVGRIILPRRHHRGRQADGRLEAPARAALGPLPNRLRHLDQRTLGQLRRHCQGIPRLARAACPRSGAPNCQRQCRPAVRAATEGLSAISFWPA